ncbi:uncharacterized protein ACWYII_016254 [Salvelinus alpinus]
MFFIHSALFLMLVATTVAQTGVPQLRYSVDQWTISVEIPQTYDSDELQPYDSDELQPYDSDELQPYDSDELQPYDSDELQPYDSDETPGVEEQGELKVSPVWLLLLVIPLVLLTAMGALSVGYYMCVWRVGRIGYWPSRDLLTKC